MNVTARVCCLSVMIAFVLVHNFVPSDLRIHFYFTAFKLEIDLSLTALLYTLGKIKHIVYFAIMAFLALPIFLNYAYLKTVLLLLSVSVLIELQQSFISGRNGRIQDLLPNAVGTMLGFYFLYLWSKNKSRKVCI